VVRLLNVRAFFFLLSHWRDSRIGATNFESELRSFECVEEVSLGNQED